jgi:NitT/TauT family transport system permease protein
MNVAATDRMRRAAPPGAAAGRGRLRKAAGWVYRRAPVLITMVPLLALWEILGRMQLFLVLPPLSSVLTAMWDLVSSGRLSDAVPDTLLAIAIGLAISLIAGIAFGIALGMSPLLDEVFGPYVDVMMSSPVSAIVPALVLVFGTGRESIVVTVVLFTFFLIVVNTQAGVKQLDPALREMALSFQCSGWVMVRRVIIPGALPLILAGARMGVGRSFNGAVFGEMLISIVGLGGLLMTFGSRFMFDRLDALIILIVGTAVIIVWLFELLERRLLRNR